MMYHKQIKKEDLPTTLPIWAVGAMVGIAIATIILAVTAWVVT